MVVPWLLFMAVSSSEILFQKKQNKAGREGCHLKNCGAGSQAMFAEKGGGRNLQMSIRRAQDLTHASPPTLHSSAFDHDFVT